jgi:hypothetical protein|nr:MAG TPA: hypothetical protein [Caudoviricetes sp.]
MLEPTLMTQLLGAGLIAISFYTAGLMTYRHGIKKKEKEQRKQDKIAEMLNLQEEYEQEVKASVWDDLAIARKCSVSDNNFKTY